MNTEEAKALSETATARLLEALQQGQSETLRTYWRMMSRFHRYSWGNVLLILTQDPQASRAAGFHAWRKLGRYVRKGEKAIVILAPMVRRASAREDDIGDDRANVFGFRPAHVFDVRQTEGDALPQFAVVQGNPGHYTERLKCFVADSGISLRWDGSIAPAQGISSGGQITLFPGLSPAEEFAVLSHETAHELLHNSHRRMETTHAARETEAEAVAYVLCSAIGLDTNTSCEDYIRLHAGDRNTLTASLACIQQTASYILAAITGPSEPLDPD